MKVAIFHNLPSGGAKRALYTFTKFLTKSDHAVEVFVPSTADETYLPLENLVSQVNVFDVRGTFSGAISSTLRYFPLRIPADLERVERNIADTINEQDFDVVLCEQDRYTSSPFFLKYIKKPTIYYCQQPARSQELRNLARNELFPRPQSLRERSMANFFDRRLLKTDKRNASFANHILTNSYFSRESILRSYGLNSFVSYLGVDTEIFKPLSIPKENFVLSVGSLAPRKGFDFIVSSLGTIDARIRPRLVIVSNVVDSHLKSSLEQFTQRIGVDLRMESSIANDALVALYNKAQLVLYAPYLEPFGLVPLEAMACGTPVVAVKEGGVRESVIHNKTGVLTERDEHIFAHAVMELLSDKEKIRDMSQKAIKCTEDYWTVEKAGKRLTGHMNRVVDEHRDQLDGLNPWQPSYRN
ncbi:MAG: glycosyltransferase family 4 protein [Halobacteriota archaeon]